VCFSEQYVPDTPQARQAIATAAMSPSDVAGQLIEQEIRADLLDDEQAGALHAGPGFGSAGGDPAPPQSGRKADRRRHPHHPSDRFSIKMSLPLDAG